MGDVATDEPVLVRVHSECLTGDVFGSQRCDCGGQLHAAMRQIQDEGLGAMGYAVQEHVSGHDVDGSELTRVALLRRPEGGCEGDEKR